MESSNVRTAEENQMVEQAYNALNTKYRVLMPKHTAVVEWAEFDPFAAVQVIARVTFPAVVNMRVTTCTHAIMDGAVVHNAPAHLWMPRLRPTLGSK